jgi:hypothetical protein
MVRRILSFLAISAAIYGGIALGLILSQGARGDLGEGGLDFSAEIAKGGAWQAPELQVAMRDGMPLAVRDFPARRDGSPLLILVHGSNSASACARLRMSQHRICAGTANIRNGAATSTISASLKTTLPI